MTPPVSAPALVGLCWNIHDSPVTLIYSVSLSGEDVCGKEESHAQWAREGQTEKKAEKNKSKEATGEKKR